MPATMRLESRFDRKGSVFAADPGMVLYICLLSVAPSNLYKLTALIEKV